MKLKKKKCIHWSPPATDEKKKKKKGILYISFMYCYRPNSINGLQSLWWSAQKEIFVAYLITSYPSFVYTRRDYRGPILFCREEHSPKNR